MASKPEKDEGSDEDENVVEETASKDSKAQQAALKTLNQNDDAAATRAVDNAQAAKVLIDLFFFFSSDATGILFSLLK